MEIIDLRALVRSLEPILQAAKNLSEGNMPNMSQAVGDAARSVEQTWVGFASGQAIPGFSRKIDNAEYRQGITSKKLGAFHWIISSGDSKATKSIEEGTEERDLKQEVSKWRKRRTAKDGHAYAYIPFRHGSKTVPTAAKSLKPSVVTGERQETVAGKAITRLTYKWGEHLSGANVPKRQLGMVRFLAGAGKRTSYMTFRTLSAKSPAGSWIIKAKPGVPLPRIVRQAVEQDVTKIVQAGIDKDLGLI